METLKSHYKEEKGLFNEELSKNALDTLCSIDSFSKENYYEYLDDNKNKDLKIYFDYASISYKNEMNLLREKFRTDDLNFIDLPSYLRDKNLSLLPCFCLNYISHSMSLSKPHILSDVVYGVYYNNHAYSQNIILDSYVIYVDDYQLINEVIHYNNITLPNKDMLLLGSFVEKEVTINYKNRNAYNYSVDSKIKPSKYTFNWS